ncbi:hypothetical protein DAEQUDRAFT_730733 [Daedalea quercina L-15889]|uniref:DUF6533 domain-containing protein n=1 Tax=Daedalea quercina L-15889 TaxID=1314783 RepID=A0A165MTE0_9APHY|nr:hypothetical protein DAEQUDRAFT_730733 [Daedalea quercina L-15889]
MSTTNAVANASYSMLLDYVLSVTAAVHVYDRVLNIGQEIDCMWRRHKNKKIMVPILYFTMHSSASLFLLLVALPDDPTCQSYLAVSILQIGAICLLQAVATAIAGLRVYTISDRGWKLTGIVISLGLVPIAANLYCAARWEMTVLPGFDGCILTVTWSPATGRMYLCSHTAPMIGVDVICRVDICATTSLVLVDGLVFVAMWRRSGGVQELRQLYCNGGMIKRPTMGLLLRDGALQFGALFVLNSVAAVVQFKSDGFLGTNLTILLAVITNILLSHMLFNVYEAACPHEPCSSPSQLSSLFSKVVFQHLDGILPQAGPHDDSPLAETGDMDDMDNIHEGTQSEDDVELSSVCTIHNKSSGMLHCVSVEVSGHDGLACPRAGVEMV